MGGHAEDSFDVSFLIAGIAAGIVAGFHTIKSRRKNGGAEGIAGIVCYYVAIVIYWAVWVVVERVTMSFEFGRWTDFDFHDHLKLLWVYLLYGTAPYGVVLIPLCFLNRWLVWRVFNFKVK